jgi:hypothetical protein
MSNLRPDILISDREGAPIAAVEVKNRQDMTPEVARVLRRNLIVHGYVPPTPYFLLVSQDVGYLWKNVKPEDIDVPPDYEFPLTNVISRYLRSQPPRRLSGNELELVILEWLIELTVDHRDPHKDPERTLATAGFEDAIKGGRVVAEAVA